MISMELIIESCDDVVGDAFYKKVIIVALFTLRNGISINRGFDFTSSICGE